MLATAKLGALSGVNTQSVEALGRALVFLGCWRTLGDDGTIRWYSGEKTRALVADCSCIQDKNYYRSRLPIKSLKLPELVNFSLLKKRCEKKLDSAMSMFYI